MSKSLRIVVTRDEKKPGGYPIVASLAGRHAKVKGLGHTVEEAVADLFTAAPAHEAARALDGKR